jgi:hypothetical protein
MPKASSSPKQLNVRSDKAYHLARTLAHEQKKSTQTIVEEALQDYAAKMQPLADRFSVEQNAMLQHFKVLSEEFSNRWKQDEGADHSDMYDENGLPK